MADLTGTAEYSEKMERLETTTPGHADVWNIRHQLLLNNDAFLKREKERLEQALEEYYEQLVAYTDKVVADLIGGAPTMMDTLKELADEINANKSIQEALDAAIGTKASQSELNTLSGNLTKHKTSTDHDGRYYTEAETDSKVGILNTNLANHKASGDHDGRYYTEAEINNLLAVKAALAHLHDDRYYTEAEVNNLLNGKINTSASCNKNWNWSGQGGQPQWLWGGNDPNTFNVWNPSNFSVNYANSANRANSAGSADSVAWGNVSGKPGTYPPSDHGHGYLPTGGGTINGNLGITGGLSANYIYTQTPGGTLHLNVAGWLNIETDQQLQVRNKANNAWKPVAAAAFNQQSSRRYKKNIEDMTEECARKILQLRPVIYDYKNEADGKGCMGFIAEEVDEIITYPVAYNADGGVEGIDYSKFASPLVKMQQIHETEISRLKAEVLNLKEVIEKTVIG